MSWEFDQIVQYDLPMDMSSQVAKEPQVKISK